MRVKIKKKCYVDITIIINAQRVFTVFTPMIRNSFASKDLRYSYVRTFNKLGRVNITMVVPLLMEELNYGTISDFYQSLINCRMFIFTFFNKIFYILTFDP